MLKNTPELLKRFRVSLSNVGRIFSPIWSIVPPASVFLPGVNRAS